MEGQNELEEVVEKAHGRFERTVGAGMAVIAAILALVSVSAHVLTTEELLAQQRASNQWAYYQSKAIRRYQSEFAQDVLGAVKSGAAARYAANAVRYQKEAEEIQKEARAQEHESGIKGRQALRLEAGEVFLEIAIVFSSLAILTRRAPFWWTGAASAVAGAALSATVFLVGG